MDYDQLVDDSHESLVDLITINEIKEAKELAETIRIMYRRDLSLRSLIHEMRIQHKEARENS